MINPIKTSSPVEKANLPIPEIKVTIEDTPPLSEKIYLETTEQQALALRQSLGQDTIRLKKCVCALYLRGDNSVIGFIHTDTGGSTTTTFDGQLIIGAALKSRAGSVITCHTFTHTIKTFDIKSFEGWNDALGLFHIEHLDHIILFPDGYLSAVEEGIITKEE